MQPNKAKIKIGVRHSITYSKIRSLPIYVQDKMNDITDTHEVTSFIYHEETGTIDSTSKEVSKQIMLRNGEDNKWIYTGGSSCWIIPRGHYLTFEKITFPLISLMPGNEWWILILDESQPLIHVYYIHIVTENEVTESFPNL